jgi:hypothetical protein
MRTLSSVSVLALTMALLAAAPVTGRASTSDQAVLRPRETAVDATASFLNAPSLHLADVTVLSLRDRTVKLRFTMAGIPPAPFSTTCAAGQALVSVRVNVLVLPRPE